MSRAWRLDASGFGRIHVINKEGRNMRLKKAFRDCSKILYGAGDANFAEGKSLRYQEKVWALGKPRHAVVRGPHSVSSFLRLHGVSSQLMWLSQGFIVPGFCKMYGGESCLGSLHSSSSDDVPTSCTLHCAIWQLISPVGGLRTGNRASRRLTEMKWMCLCKTYSAGFFSGGKLSQTSEQL